MARSDESVETNGPAEALTAKVLTARLPAHARSKPLHWIATAAGVASVVGLVLVVGPAGAAQRVAGDLPGSGAGTAAGTGPGAGAATGQAAHPIPAASAPNPAKAKLPIDCAGQPVKIDQQFAAALPGSGTPVTVASARCDAAAGTPPDGLYVLEPGKGAAAAPVVAATLIDPLKRMTVQSVTMRSDGSVRAVVSGYSSANVPNCCPDINETLSWALTKAGSWAQPVVVANGASV
ncbi:hypothetical protein [Streptacidiphilus fuscans]|uniref:Secreted protein n=1 Tax=Streptacidiphilus fuscans TaxID=2789292 RepID=A0A931FEC8_9ACTN|nr:hypothetical protein [Streptacidiphilus fuscans]MBF9068511.1 hypothetical protein [Streptacidiphilus fuscans]